MSDSPELARLEPVVGNRPDPHAPQRTTGWPIASHILRTWRLRPSWMTSDSDALPAADPTRRPSQTVTSRRRRAPAVDHDAAREPLERVPSGTPRTRTWYSRATPWLRMRQRAARSPSLVSSSSPSES